MIGLNKEVVAEKTAELQASMAKEIEGMDIRDCDLIGAIASITHESNKLEGVLACVVLFHGTEEEWFEEREALLRNYEQNSIEALKEMLRVDGLSLSIVRCDEVVTLHGQLTTLKSLFAERGVERYIIYVAQKTTPGMEQVAMSNVFHGQKFDWMFKPSLIKGPAEFTLSLLAIPAPGEKAVSYTYRVDELVPDHVSHVDNWPNSVFIDIPGHRKIFEVVDCDPNDVAVASDLLQLFLTETGQLAANNDASIVFYAPRYTSTRQVSFSEFGERLFQSPRFQEMLPKSPKATITVAEVDQAMALYDEFLKGPHGLNRDVVFISTSMHGEEFVNIRDELDQLMAVETTNTISMMFHTFVPESIDREDLLGYVREAINPERHSFVFISPNFKYKECESEQQDDSVGISSNS